MRTCTPPTSTDVQHERPSTAKRVDERVAERAAEQERRRREAVSFKLNAKIFFKIIIIIFFSLTVVKAY